MFSASSELCFRACGRRQSPLSALSPVFRRLPYEPTTSWPPSRDNNRWQPLLAKNSSVRPKAAPTNPNQIGNLPIETAARRTLELTGDVERGKSLFTVQNCRACHTDADGQTPKGPHLVDIGKRYKAAELVESILQPSVKLAQGYETYTFLTADGEQVTGFVVSQRASSVALREWNGMQRELLRTEIEAQKKQEKSTMPDGLVANLTPDQLADLIAYLQSL